MLSWSEISTYGEWRTPTFRELDIVRYRALTGEGSDSYLGPTTASPGLAVVAARRAFTGDMPLPPGGVLLRVDLSPGDGWNPFAGTEYRCDTSDERDHKGRLRVQIDVQLRSPELSGVPDKVGFTLLWPENAENVAAKTEKTLDVGTVVVGENSDG